MGCVASINHEKFPAQGRCMGKRVKVCFHYNSEKVVAGTIVRDDREEPFQLIIALDDGRYVRGVECYYMLDEDDRVDN